MFPWYLQLITGVLVVVTGYFIHKVTEKLRSKNVKEQPPLYSGWIPWLGCAVEFGKSPLMFIEAKRQEMGPVFTLKVAGERMTFLTQPADFQLFFQSPSVDFQKAVQDAVQNVASVTPDVFFRNHTKIHDTLKGFLAATNLSDLTKNLFQEFKKHLSEIHKQNDTAKSTKTELLQLVRSSMYKSVISNLFGSDILPVEHEETFQELEKNFIIFDEQFELGARLPHIFLKDFSTAKRWLLSLFADAVARIQSDLPVSSTKQNLVQVLLSVVDKEFAPNWSLLLLWASLANAIPITFWTLAFIYSHPHVLAKTQAEMAALLKSETTVSETNFIQLPYVKQCVFEAIRLRSPGIITRRVVQEVTAQGYTIPVGDLLMVSPYWAHRNPESFPEPDVFKPERWTGIDKAAFPEEFLAFGGGRYQCPGRWFALMEIHLYVALFLSMFDCHLLDGVSDVCTLHLVGTQQPADPCPVLLTNHQTP
ncbi:hypothetical protein BsWGS_28125 [Bradybaena similaris]